MKIYFVRHGKSFDHEINKRQSPESVLGTIGKEQAKLVAKRFNKSKEKVDKVFTSRWPRAFETAKSIGKSLGKEIEIVEGIHEKEQSTVLYGADIESKEYKNFLSEVKKNGADLDWKYKGKGESLRDVIKRVEKFQNHLLKKHKGENLIVVSHGNFIRCFIARIILGKNYNDLSFYKVFGAIHIENTGVTLIEYLEEEKEWWIVYLNDHSHLEKLIDRKEINN